MVAIRYVKKNSPGHRRVALANLPPVERTSFLPDFTDQQADQVYKNINVAIEDAARTPAAEGAEVKVILVGPDGTVLPPPPATQAAGATAITYSSRPKQNVVMSLSRMDSHSHPTKKHTSTSGLPSLRGPTSG